MGKPSLAVVLCSASFLCAACGAEDSQKPTIYPDQQSKVFQEFSKQCSTCHRPPMPDVHRVAEWPAVLERMQQHKQQRGLVRMNKVQQQQVLAYLQAHAKKDLP